MLVDSRAVFIIALATSTLLAFKVPFHASLERHYVKSTSNLRTTFEGVLTKGLVESTANDDRV